ncbi:glutathione S-transferase theta-1-like [Haematobia irritans]|uniref:glutathione S-transferase theta-1-like n=1 Tax=Haematobia irritans TaxID=7368 RepID=UPI003F4FD1A2
MTKVKFFYDLISQPARAMWIALQMSKIPYEDCPVALRKLEHRSSKYKKINRFQKVPCIVDGDFHLSESIAILRYLSDKGQFSDKLYPKDTKIRAKVDEFLEWQHLGLRLGCSSYFVHLWLLPMSGQAEVPSVTKLAKLQEDVENSLKVMENIWLKDSQFLTGNKLTVADIYGASEIEQIKLGKYDVSEKFSKISTWLARVRDEANPFYDLGHKQVNKFAEKLK